MELTPTIVVFVGRNGDKQKLQFDDDLHEYGDVLRSVAVPILRPPSDMGSRATSAETITERVEVTPPKDFPLVSDALRAAFSVVDPVEYKRLIDRGFVADRIFTAANIIISLEHKDLDYLPGVLAAVVECAKDAKLNPLDLRFLSVFASAADIESRRPSFDAIHSVFAAQEPRGALEVGLFSLGPYYYGTAADEPDRFLPAACVRVVELLAGFARPLDPTGLRGLTKIVHDHAAGASFLVGLEGYMATHVDAAADVLFGDAVWRRVSSFCVGEVLTGRDLIRAVQQSVGPSLVANSTLDVVGGDAERELTVYRQQYLPAIINSLAPKCRSYVELVSILREIQRNVTPANAATKISVVVGAALTPIFTDLNGAALLIIGALAGAAGLWWFLRKSPTVQPEPPTETLPKNGLLARALEEFLAALPAEVPADQASSRAKNLAGDSHEFVFDNVEFNAFRSKSARQAADDVSLKGFTDAASALLFLIPDNRWRPTATIGRLTEVKNAAAATIRKAILLDFEQFVSHTHSAKKDLRVHMFHTTLPQSPQMQFRIVPEEFASSEGTDDERVVLGNAINYLYLIRAQ